MDKRQKKIVMIREHGKKKRNYEALVMRQCLYARLQLLIFFLSPHIPT